MNGFTSFLQRHRQANHESWQRLTAKPLTASLSILTLSIIFVLLSLFVEAWQNFNAASQHWEQHVKLALFLKPEITVEQAQALTTQLNQQPQFSSAKLVPPADALQTLNQQTQMQDVLQELPQNPLPAVIELNIAPSLLKQPADLNQVQEHLQQQPAVEFIQFDFNSVKQTEQLFFFGKQALLTTSLLLGLAAVLIIGQALHLLLSHFWRELHLRLAMGAKPSVIILPFVYMGIWCGSIAALLAFAVTALVSSNIEYALKTILGEQFVLAPTSISELSLLLLISVVLCAVIVRLAVRRQLRLKA